VPPPVAKQAARRAIWPAWTTQNRLGFALCQPADRQDQAFFVPHAVGRDSGFANESARMAAKGNGSQAGAAPKPGLPPTTEASVANKLDRYLLNPDYPVGGPKAKWFKEALGFDRGNAADLAKQIKFDEAKATVTDVTQHGTKYNQVITIQGANGRVIDVNFAWIRNQDGVVRLVTSIPTPK
jgi:hypothetical protein